MNYYLPEFLIIGAMKCGTTTLYRDLMAQSRIYFPIDKEPGILYMPYKEDKEVIGAYKDIYKHKNRGQLAGDASTIYTKLPDYKGIPHRARRLLGRDLKLIYIIRDPIKRIISHHHHDYQLGKAGDDINIEVYREKKYISYSSYYKQLRAWLEYFDKKNIYIMVFEEYIEDREKHLKKIIEFLGLEYEGGLIDNQKAYNSSKGKMVASGIVKYAISSKIYRKVIRPNIKESLRDRIKPMLMRKSRDDLKSLTRDTEEYLMDVLQPEIEEIRKYLGRTHLWYC